jgi:MFS family permease
LYRIPKVVKLPFKSVFLSLLWACVVKIYFILVAFIGGLNHSIPTIIVSQFLQGFGASSILPLSYAFLSDYCSDKFKPRAVIIVNTAW